MLTTGLEKAGYPERIYQHSYNTSGNYSWIKALSRLEQLRLHMR